MALALVDVTSKSWRMLDARLRPLIDPPLNRAARLLGRRGISATSVTLAGVVIGLAGAVAIALGWFVLGGVALVGNRIADSLDGPLARLQGTNDAAGGFLDIACDFLIYAAVPLAFAVHAPAANGLAAAFLLSGFVVNGAAFLAFARAADDAGLTTQAQGEKSFFYLAGLAEGGETFAFLCAVCLFPSAFVWLATAFAVVCWISGLARMIGGYRRLRGAQQGVRVV
ncbi:MAG: CDP-alcohol phosphatidyltransferase family protein [Pseudomonadota bacterium]